MRLTYLLIAATTLLLISSCKKDPSSIGLNIHPQSDKVTGAVLNFNGIHAYTFSEDSISTDERTLSLLGSYNDPVFGLSSASFITQLRLASFNPSFGTNPVADSMLIELDYQSYYGDTSTALTFSMYELSSAIYPDSSYYSNFDPSTVANPAGLIGTYSFLPKPNDTALVISLPPAFAQKFINAPSTVWASNTAFLDFFRGFYFEADTLSPGGSVIYFNLLSTRTKIKLYYHNDSGSSSFSFSINANCARINLFNHNFSTSQIAGLNDSVSVQNNLFIQGMSGTGVRMFFPGLQTYRDSGRIVISKAELVIPVNPSFTTTSYPSPSRLLNVAFNADKSYAFLPDYLSGEAYFNGNLSDNGAEYRFNIGRYVQELIDGDREDYGIALLCSDNRVSANRVVLSNTNVSNGVRLEIYYFKP